MPGGTHPSLPSRCLQLYPASFIPFSPRRSPRFARRAPDTFEHQNLGITTRSRLKNSIDNINDTCRRNAVLVQRIRPIFSVFFLLPCSGQYEYDSEVLEFLEARGKVSIEVSHSPVLIEGINSNEELPPLTHQIGYPMGSDCTGASTLDRRLLCACICSYDIKPEEPYFQYVEYKPGTQAKRISRGVNSVLIGKNVDGIVVSFQGTTTTSPLDWLQNAAIFLSECPDGIQGKIHSGFSKAVVSLYKPIQLILVDMLKSSNKTNIYLTGHSKGGALASITAILMKQDPDLPDPTYVCTFGSPRVGNSAFRDQYNKEINQTSYENHLDLIPFLPPSKTTMEPMAQETTSILEDVLWTKETEIKKTGYGWDFQPLGTRLFIDENQQIRSDVNKALDDQRIHDIETKTLFSLRRFRAAHSPLCPSHNSCDGGYLLALAPEVCQALNNKQS